MAEHANLYLANQYVMAADILFFNQAQFTQLLKMMKSNARTAKMQGTLNLSDTHGSPVF